MVDATRKKVRQALDLNPSVADEYMEDALVLLMEAEWHDSWDYNCQTCPWCKQPIPHETTIAGPANAPIRTYHVGGHAPDCRLVALLVKAGVRK